MAIGLIFMFIIVATPSLLGLNTIESSVHFYTQRAVVDNPLIGVTNTQLPSGELSYPWYTPTNAARPDGQYASVSMPVSVSCGTRCTGTSASAYLTTQLYNFTIPKEAVISGVIVQVVGHYTSQSGAYSHQLTDNSVRLVQYGKFAGTEHATTIEWPTTDSVIQYGGSNDTWGLALTQDMVMRPDFGVALSLRCSQTFANGKLYCYGYIDFVSITIAYYLPVVSTSTSGGSTVTVTSTPATVTMTYSPTTYTFSTPSTVVTNSASTTTTVTLTTATGQYLPWLSSLSTDQLYALTVSLFTFLSGFGLSLFGVRRP